MLEYLVTYNSLVTELYNKVIKNIKFNCHLSIWSKDSYKKDNK